MYSRRTFGLAFVVLLLGGAASPAHENFRVIGTLAKVMNTSVDVKQTKDGKVITIRTNRQTQVLRNNKPIERTELKVGLHVVVDARGDTLADAIAQSIRLVPAPATRQ